MLRKLQYICLVGSIGLIAADRIDLLAGRSPFKLTPFLVLAPLVLLISVLRAEPARMFRFTITAPIRRQTPFLAASSLFLLLSFASVPIGLDPERGLVALSDLFLVAVLGYYISVQVLEDRAPEKLIVWSVTFGLIVYIIFCIAEFIAWSHGIVMVGEPGGPWIESTFAPSTLGLWAPTLSGTAYDANRSGFVLTMYLALLDRFAAKSRYTPAFRFAIASLIFLTLSRSGVLCWLAYYLFSRTFWKRLASRRVLVRVAAIVIVSSLVLAVYQKQMAALAETWEIADAVSAKMSMDPGSSGESHILLIERGLKTWLTSTKTVITGIGYAAAPKVLQDFFGNDKRGNFHSLYVTTLAEMGLPAFLVLVFLLGYPIIERRGVVPCMAAIMVFNISYQTETEPMFWLMLALLWSYERRGKRAAEPSICRLDR
jgi:O-Antigen ligase